MLFSDFDIRGGRVVEKDSPYPGNLGFEEMIKFQAKATPSQQKKMDELIDRQDWNAYKLLIKQVLGVSLDSDTSTDYQGIPIIIEQPEGSKRTGKEDGKKWETVFFHQYGYIKGVPGADGEDLDCMIGPNPNSNFVYIIHQSKHGKYDEDKVQFGFDNLDAARDAYLAHYNTQGHLGPISEMTVEDFKKVHCVGI